MGMDCVTKRKARARETHVSRIWVEVCNPTVGQLRAHVFANLDHSPAIVFFFFFSFLPHFCSFFNS